MIVFLVLAVSLSPRLRIGALESQAVDLRVQDVLLVPAFAYVVYRSWGPRRKMRAIWGDWALIFMTGGSLLTLFHLLRGYNPLLVSLGSFGRALEVLVFAGVTASLFVIGGRRSARAFANACLIAVASNTVWLGVQAVGGFSSTLVGDVYGSSVYGPRLVGEPSVFGSGVFWVWTTALGVAHLRSRSQKTWLSAALILCGVLGAVLVESRVALGSCVLLVVLLAFRGRTTRSIYLGRLVVTVGAMVAVLIMNGIDIAARLTVTDIVASSVYRAQKIWEPLMAALWANPLTGIGPGGLDSQQYALGEAHNAVLRAVVEYGLVIGAAYVLVYVVGAYRAHQASKLLQDSGLPEALTRLAGYFGLAVLLMGLFQDSLTAVMSTHMLALCLGVAGGEVVLHRTQDDSSSERRMGTST